MTIARVSVSRPLRAVFIVLSAWIVTRAGMLWHAAVGIAVPGHLSIAVAVPVIEVRAIVRPLTERLEVPVPGKSLAVLLARQAIIDRRETMTPRSARLARTARPAPMILFEDFNTPVNLASDRPQLVPMVSSSGPRSRLSGSAWALFRPDSAGSTLGPGGTLGGAQAGVRAFYEPGPRGLALTVRLSAPLALRSGREASAGVGIRGRAVGILLERRIALDDGARNAMSVTAYGGFNDVVLPHGLRAEGYGQIGIVGARRRDAFADGAVRIVHPLSGAGTTRLAVGAALSGGAQPGVTRVDVGPELIGIVSADQRPVRITAGWRQRIAGNAAPGSGPALSVDIGF